MSSTWIAGEIISTTRLLSTIAQSIKKTSDMLNSFNRELSGLHVVLYRLKEELQKPEIALNCVGETRRTEIMASNVECNRVLYRLSQVLERCNGTIGGRRGLGTKSWQTSRYMDGEPEELMNTRHDIRTCKKSMELFLAQLSVEVPSSYEIGNEIKNNTSNIAKKELEWDAKDKQTALQGGGITTAYEGDQQSDQESHRVQVSLDEYSLSFWSDRHISKDRLESSYSVRNRDYLKFFKIGRVFTTLWTEGYGGTNSVKDSFVSTVVYGEQVHSKIRRFVVVRKADRSCVCLPITGITSKQQSRKLQSLNLSEHGIVYSNTIPGQLDGITLLPVRVQAAKGNSSFRDYSLIDYARPCTIEMNVKVKEVGMLEPESRIVLLANFKQVFLAYVESEMATPATPKTKFDETVAPQQNQSVERSDSAIDLNICLGHTAADIHQPDQNEHVEP